MRHFYASGKWPAYVDNVGVEPTPIACKTIVLSPDTYRPYVDLSRTQQRRTLPEVTR